MSKILSLVVSFSLLFQPICMAGNDSRWKKSYSNPLKSRENYTSFERFNEIYQREKWQEEQQKNRARYQKKDEERTYRLIQEQARQNLIQVKPAPPQQKINPSRIKNSENIRQPEVRKIEYYRWENPKSATPTKKITIEKKMIDGRMHTIKTIERFDPFGKLTRRDVIDRVKLDKKTTLTTIKSYTPDGTLIRQVEKLKIRTKGGYQIQKYVSTQFDSSGNPLNRMLLKNDFKRTGFFNSTLGKVLGIAGVVASAVLAPYAFAALGGALTSSSIAMTSAIGSGIAQMGLSLAQGQSFKAALISAGIALATTYIGARLGPMLTNFLKSIPAVSSTINGFQQGISKFLGNVGVGSISERTAQTAGSSMFRAISQEFMRQFTLRAGSEAFGQTLGKKVGVFGTVAMLSIGGTLLNAGILHAEGMPLSSNQLSDRLVDSILQGSLQGAIAESLKRPRGLDGQFITQLGSSLLGNISFSDVAIDTYNSSRLPNRPQGTLPALDSSGRINSFIGNVNGTRLNFSDDGSFQSFVLPAGAHITDLSKETNGLLDGYAIQTNNSLTLIDPHRGTAWNTPSLNRISSFLDDSISAMRSTAQNASQSLTTFINEKALPLIDRLGELKRATDAENQSFFSKVIDYEKNNFRAQAEFWKETGHEFSLSSGAILDAIKTKSLAPIAQRLSQLTPPSPVDMAFSMGVTPLGKINLFKSPIKTESAGVSFYVRPNGDVIPAKGYRYMDSKFTEEVMKNRKAPGSYFSFDDFNTAVEARDALQISPVWNNARLKGKFDTLQIVDDIYMPYGRGGKDSFLEPIAKTYPEYGKGGSRQAKTDKWIHFDEITLIPEE